MKTKIVLAVIIMGLFAMIFSGCGKRQCILNVETSSSGTDENGEHVGGEPFIQTVAVAEKTVLYEDFGGEFITKNESDIYIDIMSIKKIDDNGVTFIAGGETITLQYGEKKGIPSTIFVSDGANYYHVVSFKKSE